MEGLVVISPAYVAPVQTEYVLQEKVFSLADSFNIKDATGFPAFKLQGSVMTMHDRKTLLDRNQQPVAVLTKKLVTLHGTWEIFAADGSTLLATLKPKLMSLRDHVNVIIHAFGEEPHLLVKGDFRGKNFQINRGDVTLASAQRRSIFTDMTRLLTGDDSYTLAVNPGVDQAFMVALTVTLDAMFHEDGKKGLLR